MLFAPLFCLGKDPVHSLNAVSSAIFGWTCLFGHDIISPFNNLEKLPTLKFVLSFPGGISSSEVTQCRYPGV